MRDKDGNKQYPVTVTSLIIDPQGQTAESRIQKVENATYKNKGYYATVEALNTAFPKGSVGSKAYVGTNYPYAIYAWDTATNSWVNTNETGGDESVSLEDYYTKEEVNTMFADKQEVLTQEEYDALPVKDADKLYFCYE
jgi:hypothetical protein